jgi:hypothetical protein
MCRQLPYQIPFTGTAVTITFQAHRWRHRISDGSYSDRLTPWSRVLLEKLIVAHPVDKFSSFYETRKFITVFTRSRHWTLSRPRWNQSTSWHLKRSILFLSRYSHRDLPSVLFSVQVFRPTFCLRFPSLPCVLHSRWSHLRRNKVWIVYRMITNDVSDSYQ